MTKPFLPMQAGPACSSAAVCPSATTCAAANSSSSGAADDPGFRLYQAGWVRRTTIGEPRLSELAENYRWMGYEVHVEYFGGAAEVGPGKSACVTCFNPADGSDRKQPWGTVYIRDPRLFRASTSPS